MKICFMIPLESNAINMDEMLELAFSYWMYWERRTQLKILTSQILSMDSVFIMITLRLRSEV